MPVSLASFISTLNHFAAYTLFTIGDTPMTPRKLFFVIVFIWLSNFISHWVEKLIHRNLMKKDFDVGAKAAIERFTRYGIFALGIILTLAYAGVNLKTLETFGAVLGVAIGFGLQSITSDFISGLILLTERPIKRGDLVNVKDGSTGRVLDIRARSTLVLTRDDIIIVVPNSKLITEPVVNQSLSGDKIRYSVNVGVAYGSDVDLVRTILLDIANSHPKVLKSPPADVLFQNFGSSSLDFTLRIWLSELWFYEIILSEIRFEIDRSFREKNVRIPFTQMDLHVKSGPKGQFQDV